MSLFSKLNQIKDLREQAKDMQNQLGDEKVTVEKNGVTMEMDGNQKVLALNINPEMMNEGHKSKLEETIIALHNDAIKKVQKLMVEKMKASGNFNLPGLN